MNSISSKNGALLILGLFIVWAGISWYWYTCGVKGFCGSTDKNVSIHEPLPENVLPVVDQPIDTPIFDIPLPTIQKCAPYLTHAITKKGPNRKTDVVKLQLFLNKYMYTKNVLPTNGVFGTRTQLAVKQFQTIHAKEILAPYKLKYPTGNVTSRTLDTINDVVCGSAAIDKLY